MTRAAVDVGTNTVRLFIEVDGGREIRETVVVGLGRGMERSGRLSPDGVEAAISVLTEFGGLLRRHEASRVRAVATAAARTASDADEFLARATQALGHPVEVITGEEEAALSYAGALAGLPGRSSTVVVDPGGGSTEFIMGEEGYAVSVPIGSVRLTDRALPDRPASEEAVAAAAGMVGRLFAERVRLPRRPERMIGVAGTFTSLAAIHLGLERYDREWVHGAVLGLADLVALVAMLRRLDIAETAAIPSLDPGRAPVILAGAVIAVEALRLSGLPEVQVSESDLLDGIVAGLAE